MIHGKTKIELYNPNTKIKQIFRDENVFQSSVLADFMKDYGIFDANLYRSDNFRGRPLWANLVGGLFLFKNTIDTSGGVVKYKPTDNKMIGNGSYDVVNNGSPAELGSYNSSESASSASAITQVYDFATHQANGTIGCIALTSADGGLIGYGNASGDAFSSKISLTRCQNPRAYLGSKEFYYGGYVYVFPDFVSNGTLVITKTRRGITQGSVFDDSFPQTITIDTSEMSGASNWNLASSYYIDDYVFDCGSGKCRFLPWQNDWGYSTASSGSEIYYFEFDATTDTLSIGHFTNSSNNTVNYTDIVSGSHGAMFGGDYCLATNKLFKVSTSEFIKNTDYIMGGATSDDNYRSWLFDDDYIMGRVGDDFYLLDAISGDEYPINAQGYGFNKCFALNNLQGGYKNPLYLATINNLQSPVTKTAAQTMKVTYTLTEV